MTSDPHGSPFPTLVPPDIATQSPCCPLSSFPLSHLPEPDHVSESIPASTRPHQQEQPAMPTEPLNPETVREVEIIAPEMISRDLVAADITRGEPSVINDCGQKERSVEDAEVREIRGAEKAEGNAKRDETEVAATTSGVEEIEGRERAEGEGQVESSEEAGEGEGARELVTAEEETPAEDLEMDAGEQAGKLGEAKVDQGTKGVAETESVMQAVEGGRDEEVEEARGSGDVEGGRGPNVMMEEQNPLTVLDDPPRKQSPVNEVATQAGLQDDGSHTSPLPHTQEAATEITLEGTNDKSAQEDIEGGRARVDIGQGDKKESMEGSPSSITLAYNPDISPASHITPTPDTTPITKTFNESDGHVSVEMPNSQESNGSLDILCSSPIRSQDADNLAKPAEEDDPAQVLLPIDDNRIQTGEASMITTASDLEDLHMPADAEEDPEPPLPQPSFSRFAQPAPVLVKRTLKRKDTMQDLFFAMVPLKRKKVELARQPAIGAQPRSEMAPMENKAEKAKHQRGSVDDGDVEDTQEEDVVVKDMRVDDEMVEPVSDNHEADKDEDHRKGQWRVGRLPGHQGSHIKRDADGGVSDSEDTGKRGQKRSLGQSINDSAERVLKKPFRLPARVVLKPATPRPKTPPPTSSPSSSSPLPSDLNSSSPSSARNQTSGPTRSKPSSRPFSVPRKIDSTPIKPSFPTRTGTPVLPPTPQSGSASSTTRSSPFKSSPTFSKRLSKPFKTPFSRSTAPSPISSTSRSKTASTRELIAELEKEERTLRQAIKYDTEAEEDERLMELITTWRDAGQQVAELLFAVYPRPDPDATNGEASDSSKPFSMFQNDQSFFASNEYTPEQLRYIANLDTNADGDPVDNDGMPIFGNGGEGIAMDVEGMLDCKGKESDGDEADTKAAAKNKDIDSADWTIGTLLIKLGVEPEMYAWDADAEDWGKPEAV